MGLTWNRITETLAMNSYILSDGRVFDLAIETLDVGGFEWTLQYRIRWQRSGISPTLDVAVAAVEAAVAELAGG